MSTSHRRLYIDWLRGFAVLTMMLWHGVDAWTRSDVRDNVTWGWLGIIGGTAAPLFLFLAGIAVPFAGESRMRHGADRSAASWFVQKRGWQVFLIAHLFRLQSFLFDVHAPLDVIFKPDILNILGLGLVLVAFCWGRATSRRAEFVWLFLPAVVIVLLTPLVWAAWWPSVLPPRFEAYFRPVGDMGVFTLMPWIGFVFLGAWLGMRIARRAPDDTQMAWQLAIIGAFVAALGYRASYLPPLMATSFWTTSISFFVIRSGLMMLGLAVAFAWRRIIGDARQGPLVLLGQHSLFVYWIHLEIAYGFLTKSISKKLLLPQSLIAYVVLVVVMWGLTQLWVRHQLGIREAIRGLKV